MELVVIGFVAMLIFGPKMMPVIGKRVGGMIREARNFGKTIEDATKDDAK